MNKFHEVTDRLEQALEGIACDKLDISDEVKEQVQKLYYLTFNLQSLGMPTCMIGDNTEFFMSNC